MKKKEGNDISGSAAILQVQRPHDVTFK